jgi:hypothetical protein
MRFLLMVYVDERLLGELEPAAFDAQMKGCLEHADALQAKGKLVDFQQLEPTAAARSVRIRAGKTTVMDGPFAETKEILAGFNLVEAESLEAAVRMAEDIPWARYGCIEVRPVRDIGAVRARVGA